MEKKTLEEIVISKLENLGVIKEKIDQILKADIFDDLCKHNHFWQYSDEENQFDKLNDIRMKVSWINDQLYEIFAILTNHDLE